MNTANIRVLLCHDHEVLRTGLARLLAATDGFEVVATAAEGGEGVEATMRLHPDVVLMDLAMPRIDSIDVTRQIAALTPPSSVLLLTGFPNRARIRAALDAGASGWVLKDATPPELLSAVRAAAARALPSAGADAAA
jgi:DNA-binding NarL/FixJ family response regulator